MMFIIGFKISNNGIEEGLDERQKNCPYCHCQSGNYGKPITGNFINIGGGLIHSDEGWYFATWSDDVEMINDDEPVITCPMCGRPLNEEKE